MPEEERQQRIARVIEEFETHRAERMQEMPWEEQRKRFGRRRFDPNTPPPPEMMLSFGRSDFWALIHVEDAAQAFDLVKDGPEDSRAAASFWAARSFASTGSALITASIANSRRPMTSSSLRGRYMPAVRRSRVALGSVISRLTSFGLKERSELSIPAL